MATDATAQTIGQNGPALLSHTVPFHRKYCPIPNPSTHGTRPNAIAVAAAVRRIGEVSMRCSFRQPRGKSGIEQRASYRRAAFLCDIESWHRDGAIERWPEAARRACAAEDQYGLMKFTMAVIRSMTLRTTWAALT